MLRSQPYIPALAGHFTAKSIVGLSSVLYIGWLKQVSHGSIDKVKHRVDAQLIAYIIVLFKHDDLPRFHYKSRYRAVLTVLI